MALPLPNLFANNPGGGLVTAMGGINALANNMSLRNINAVKAQYAPITELSKAASQATYANMMGPQYIAKMMQNDGILANLPDPVKQQLLQRATNGGMMGASSANAINQMLSQAVNQTNGSGQPTNSLHNWIKNKLQNAFNQTPNNASSQPVNAMASVGNTNGPISNNDQQNRNAGLAQLAQYYKSPQGQQEMTNEGYPNGYPPANQLTMGQGQAPMSQAQTAPTYAQNTGAYKGTVAQGEEAGKIRAKNINDLSQMAYKANTTLTSLKPLNQLVASPEFEQIRQIPLANQHEFQWYGQFGTPAQKRMVGTFTTLINNIVKGYGRDFSGNFRAGEQELANQMLPTKEDMPDVMKGKEEAITYLTQMIHDRANVTTELMTKNPGMNQLQAENIADKQVNGDQIRQSIHDQLNPTVNIKNNKTGEKRTIPIAEARKMGVPNV